MFNDSEKREKGKDFENAFGFFLSFPPLIFVTINCVINTFPIYIYADDKWYLS